jgi:PHD/YefM family antitoxin component YafN of YafNO toxin-antitoxin module
VEAKMTFQEQLQYVSDEKGRPVGVIVPIEIWREIESERETAYLLKSESMKKRLLEAKNRTGGVPLEEAAAQLGI